MLITQKTMTGSSCANLPTHVVYHYRTYICINFYSKSLVQEKHRLTFATTVVPDPEIFDAKQN